MNKKPNYRVLSPEQTEKILTAFEKAHGRYPNPREAMSWAKSAEGRAVLDASVFYEQMPTDPPAYKLKLAAMADKNDEAIAAGKATLEEIFTRFETVLGIIRSITFPDGFSWVPLKGIGPLLAGAASSDPYRETTLSAVNVSTEDAVVLMKKYGGEDIAAVLEEHGVAAALGELDRCLQETTRQ